MQESNQPQELSVSGTEKRNKRKKTILTWVLLLVLFGLTFYAVFAITESLSGGDMASFRQIIDGINPYFLLILVGVMVLFFLTDALKYSVISKMTVNRFNYEISFKVAVLGRFYDNITPFNTGGQPFQMVYYHQKGYETGIATAIPLVKYIVQLIAWIVVSLVFYIVNHSVLDLLPSAMSITIKVTTYLGIAIASLAPIAVILFSALPNLTHKIIDFFIRIGMKLKLIKDYDKINGKILEFLNTYHNAFLIISQNKLGLLSLLLVSAIDHIIVMSVPFFVLISIGAANPSVALFFDVVTLNCYSLFAASLIPTPGNSGAIETSASMVFSPVSLNPGALVWIVFIWRFCTYYIYILFGIIGQSVHSIRRIIAQKRAKKGQINE